MGGSIISIPLFFSCVGYIPYLFAVYIRYMYGGSAWEMRALISIDAYVVWKKEGDVKTASKRILRAERIY